MSEIQAGPGTGSSPEEAKRRIFAIERPESSLMKYYIIQALLTGPFAVFILPPLYFRYHTLRYRFDEEGISMRWGILFRKEVNLTYSRIQDIHLSSGIIERWLGLARIQIQTASGSASAEMTIEGLTNHEEIRNYLYSRMRGQKDEAKAAPSTQPYSLASNSAAPALAPLLIEIAREVRALREDLQAARGPAAARATSADLPAEELQEFREGGTPFPAGPRAEENTDG